ncbi:hypothetical protein ABMA70_11625 [Halobacteriovorax sp. XZX-3]|uniref:hypothetical protein n=1 Tax=unclassified Halobacteriovorax TaxID=2639665 RepID=UPI000CD2FF9C|nr:hypothetical protein [Halobacteriovorax sp. DA5]POB13982.1 hypothetical protein C0Z22_07950 [Halobacteriovorax sp. DA5]
MKKIILCTLLSFLSVHAATIATSQYQVATFQMEKNEITVSFVESAPFYQAKKKDANCFQKAIEDKEKVEIKYDYKTFQIQSCKNL